MLEAYREQAGGLSYSPLIEAAGVAGALSALRRWGLGQEGFSLYCVAAAGVVALGPWKLFASSSFIPGSVQRYADIATAAVVGAVAIEASSGGVQLPADLMSKPALARMGLGAVAAALGFVAGEIVAGYILKRQASSAASPASSKPKSS